MTNAKSLARCLASFSAGLFLLFATHPAVSADKGARAKAAESTVECQLAKLPKAPSDTMVRLTLTAPDGSKVPVTTATNNPVAVSGPDGAIAVTFVARKQADGIAIEVLDNPDSMTVVESRVMESDSSAASSAKVSSYVSGFDFELVEAVPTVDGVDAFASPAGEPIGQCCINCSGYRVCCTNCCACGRCCITP